MDSNRHKTQKKLTDPIDASSQNSYTSSQEPVDTFKSLLEDSAREAYSRPWHRIERGLRLNRLRIFIEDIAGQFNMLKDEKDKLFLYLQSALDRKLLNTLKVVNYDQEKQRILTIRGLELRRSQDGTLRWEMKKQKTDGTRKKKKGDDIPCVSTYADAMETKIEQNMIVTNNST